MEPKECYEAFGGDYMDAVQRLQNDALIKRFALKFLSDPSFEMLESAVEKKDYEEAFRAAHTLKGVSQNLGFKELGDASSLITEALRDRTKAVDEEQCDRLMGQVKAAYDKTTGAIRMMSEA